MRRRVATTSRARLLVGAIVAIVAIVGSVAGPSALAQPSAQDGFRAEVTAGTLGSALAGVGTYLGVNAICRQQAEDGPALYCIVYGMMGYVAALPLGGTAGVHIAASIRGTEGATWSSVLGAIGGEAAGLLMVRGTGALLDDPPEAYLVLAYLGITPLASGLGAAWGFNAGT